jgi:ABC-type hemin transport system ATPase subunit
MSLAFFAVTGELLAQVFKVTGAVSRAPPGGMPFVLPHHCATLR